MFSTEDEKILNQVEDEFRGTAYIFLLIKGM